MSTKPKACVLLTHSKLMGELESLGRVREGVVVCDEADFDILSEFGWELYTTGGYAHRLDRNFLAVRARLGGVWFYPHHLVLLLAEVGAETVRLLVESPLGLSEALSKFRTAGRGSGFVNNNRLDVRRENLRLLTDKAKAWALGKVENVLREDKVELEPPLSLPSLSPPLSSSEPSTDTSEEDSFFNNIFNPGKSPEKDQL